MYGQWTIDMEAILAFVVQINHLFMLSYRLFILHSFYTFRMYIYYHIFCSHCQSKRRNVSVVFISSEIAAALNLFLAEVHILHAAGVF